MRRGKLHLLGALMAVSAGATAQGIPPTFPYEEIMVIVWNEANRCSVLDRKTTCSRVAGLLNGPLQIGRDRSIIVVAQGQNSETNIRAAQLLTDLRAAGYLNVRQELPRR